MNNIFYNTAKAYILSLLLNDTLKVMLVTSSYTPSASHQYKSSITNEVSGGGYTAGGVVLSGKAINTNQASNFGFLTASNAVFSSVSITAKGAVLYKDTGTASTSLVIGYFDFGSDKTTTASDMIIEWNTEGVIKIS